MKPQTKTQLLNKVIPLFLMFIISSCSTTTEEGSVGVNRKQFLLMSSDEMVAMSNKAYDQTKREHLAKKTLDQNPAQVLRVQNIMKKLIPHTAIFRKDAPSWAWEVHVITSPEINAYCMPGGKIMFYTGIIEKLQLTDNEIAAIMGHEIAHALREHGRERMSEQTAKQVGLGILIATGVVDQKYAPAAALATAVIISLPNSRGQETEADEIGLELMARAGFDPQESVSLWKKMQAQGGAKPPQILSTHPTDSKRIENLQRLIPKVQLLSPGNKR